MLETGLSTQRAADLKLSKAQGRGGLSSQRLALLHLPLQIAKVK